jgi:hypothetical protein
MVGIRCFIKAATAATFGAAEEVPKKLGRFWERLFVVEGLPGMAGLAGGLGMAGNTPPGVAVLITPPKKDVLPPSGPVTTGLRTGVAPEIAEPSAFRVVSDGPEELKGSEFSGLVARKGAEAHQGIAPTPTVNGAVLWPYAEG